MTMVDIYDRTELRMQESQLVSVGGVISQTFSFVGRHCVALYVVALAFAALNSVQFFKIMLPKGTTLTIFNAALVATQLIGGMIAQVGLSHATVEALEGRPFSLQDALRVGFGRFLPYLGAAFLLVLAAGFASLLLIIPGIIVFCMYSQSLVLSVVERAGPILAMSRSRQMTRYNRWRIFAVYLAFYVPYLLFFFGVGAYAAIAAKGNAVALAGKMMNIQIATVVAMFVVSPLFFVMPAVLYHHMRRAERSGGLGNLSEVFA